MIMRRGCEHRMREIGLAAQDAGMELRRLDAEEVSLEANVIARKQTSVPIERGVFDRLGGDRGTELLELRERAMLNARRFRIAATFAEPGRELFNNHAVARKA